MSTLATIPLSPVTPPRATSGPSEERGVIRNVSWNFYNRLTDAIGERSSIRVAFDGKDVEIMVIGGRHESLGDLLSVRLKPFLACAGRRGHSVVARWGVRKADGEETPHPELGSCRITASGWDLTAVAPPLGPHPYVSLGPGANNVRDPLVVYYDAQINNFIS